METTDEELLDRFLGGDDGAFAALVDRYAPRAFRCASAVVRDPGIAEEVAQDAFMRLIHILRAGRYDPGRGKFASFFFCMTRNLSMDRLRTMRRTAAVPEETADAGAPSGASELLLSERRAEVRALVEALPEQERSAITLREFEGLTYREIADAMEANLETVKTWIFRARRRIEEAWLAAHSEESDARGM